MLCSRGHVLEGSSNLREPLDQAGVSPWPWLGWWAEGEEGAGGGQSIHDRTGADTCVALNS